MRTTALVLLLSIPGLATAQPEKGVLRVVSPETPTRFAPTGIVTDSERAALDLLFESLVVVSTDADGNRRVRPVLAERLPPADGVAFAFRLRNGQRWSTGEPMRATDASVTPSSCFRRTPPPTSPGTTASNCRPRGSRRATFASN